jgi:hypothetical protein
MPLLEQLLNTLPGAQRQAIQQTISELLDQEGPLNVREVGKSLRAKMDENPRGKTFLPNFARAHGRIESAVWNDAQERMFLDLVTLYVQATALESQMRDQEIITQGELLKARAAVHKITQQVRVYQFLREHPEYQDVKLVDFIDGRNESQQAPRCAIDPGIQTLELPARQRDRQQQRNFSLKTTTVETENKGGGATGGMIRDFGPENMLDGNPSTFWAELVLADGLVLQDYDASWGTRRVQGVVGEVTLKLSQASRINNIRVLPFAQFPVRVVDLAYKSSDTDEHWQTILGFSVSDATQGWLEFDFAPVQIAQLRISLEQENYVRNIYHLPKRTVANQAFWEDILDSTFDRTVHDVSLDTIKSGKIEANEKALGLINAGHLVNEELNSRNLQEKRTRQFKLSQEILDARTTVLTETNPDEKNQFTEPVVGAKAPGGKDVVEVRKYEYLYGIRQIELNTVKYQPFGYYSSTKMSPGATVLSVELDVTEDHVGFTDPHGNYFRSSIEYEVQTAENQRYPILPANYDDRFVPDEYIFVDRRTRIGWTRFAIDSSAVLVRKNGVRLNFDEYTFEKDSAKDNRGKLTVTDAAYDPNAVFTISYTATEASTMLDIEASINSTALSDPDLFDKTDRNSLIRLSYYPYIEHEIINGSQWGLVDDKDAVWRFTANQADLTSQGTSATCSVTNGSTTVTNTGTAFSGLDMGRSNYFRVKGDTRIYKIASRLSGSTILLEENYEGGTASGLAWTAGEGIEIDGVIYALNSNTYEPVRVFVNDQKAFNLTDYETLEHQAFTPIQSSGRRYQFIHAGRNIYFNTPLEDAKIEVFYSWMTQYLRVNAVMRSNIPVLTEVTPKLVDFQLKLKTTEL